MVSMGKVTNIERPGVAQREPNNALLHMSYGNVRIIAIESAMNEVQSKIYGISAPLLIGSMPMIGTNYCEVLVDEDFLQAEGVQTVDSVLDSI